LGGKDERRRHAARGFGYRPGLDGMRALALLAVLAFHQGFGVARGGYLGVSAFFTLSGFLIATIALDEHDRTGHLSWARFWERRARRLLPAALVTLAAIVVLQARWGIGAGPRFRADMLAAVGYVTNWRLAGSGSGYGALFAAPSPFVHLWSLAIEEQFYLLFPLAFAGLLVLVRGRRLAGAALLGAAATGSFALAWLTAAHQGNDGLAYYGTHTRAGELLVGVALAFVLGSAPGRRALDARAGRVAFTLAGVAALAGLAWLWHVVPIGDPHLFRGVTALNAGLTAVLIVAVLSGPVDTVLGVAPLRAIGMISYAAYLFHWPLYLVLAPPRVELESTGLFCLRLAATITAATVSYIVIESPFRFRLPMPRPGLAAVMATGVAVVVALAVVVPAGDPTLVAGAGPGGFSSVSASSTGVGLLGATPPPGKGRRPVDVRMLKEVRAVGAIAPGPGQPPATDTVLLAGDSVAWSMMVGFRYWNDNPMHGRRIRLDTHIAFGCPVGGAGVVRDATEHPTFDDCNSWRPDLPGALATSKPDAIVIVMGLEDLNGRNVDGRWRQLGDPHYDRWLEGQISSVAGDLEAPGVPVVWLTFPHVRVKDLRDPTRQWQDIEINQPAKVDRFNAVLRRAVADHPLVRVVDLAAWLQTWPGQSFNPEDRDGVHFSFDASDRVDAWLIPQVLAAIGPPRPRA
jgi:peptidoglycan/LPS O-acetylase OafA/YrhL